MSSSFIGSKIAIITKSQCRYTGTIIGIDTQASSIVLGNVKCHGTENRIGNFLNQSLIGTIVPLMQFANSDIEDLKIVENETTTDAVTQPKPSSIHDDPAIVSAVISSASNTGENHSSWPTVPTTSQQQNRSKFFDNLTLNQSSEQSWPSSNTHNYDRTRPQRNFPNPNQQRRAQPMMNSQRRFGNRETFQDNGSHYDDDFDFESSNQQFTKITSEEDFSQHQQQQQLKQQFNTEHEVIYDKKKSFFDNVAADEPSDNYGSMYNRSRNTDTFGNQRRGNYRRPNPNYSHQQQNNDNYQYRQNSNNGYHYRY